MKKALCIIFFILFVLPIATTAQNLALYVLNSYVNNKNDSIVFISLSDNYVLSENPDSSAIPGVEDRVEKDAQYLKLDSVYRKRFLSKMKISETDKLFIYDFSTAVLLSFPVRQLSVVACLNYYGAQWPYSQYDYMIGFELNKKLPKSFEQFYLYTFAFVGKKNPFVGGKLKAVSWKKIESGNFPFTPIDPADTATMRQYQCKAGNAYEYTDDSFHYYAQDFVKDLQLVARRLLVLKLKSETVVCQRIFFDHESASPSPLNFIGHNPDINQWTGKLFKNKPPVIFGFEYVSFGCPRILFLNQSENDLYINCDNRH